MNSHAEQLWMRILAHLREQGQLPLRSEQLTPLEIAAHCQEGASNERVRRFVHDYYYPHHFGQTDGALSDDLAQALVMALESGQPDLASHVSDSSPKSTSPHLCHLCAQRPIRNNPT
jgi:hypothetical protein